METIRTTTRPSTFIRPLGSFELMFWMRGQISTIQLLLAGEVEGETTPAQWRSALDLVQKRHPLFSVGIRQDEDTSLWFEHLPGNLIPMRVVNGETITRWESETEKELSIPFENDAAPLVRSVLIHYPDKAVFMIIAHHAIGDGLSLSFVLRDLLEAMNGQTLAALPFPAALDNHLGRKEPLACPPLMKDGMAPLQLQEKALLPLHINTIRLSPELTRQVIQHARRENTTLHGALLSALVRSGQETFGSWNEKAVRVLSPISVRSLVGVGEDNVLCLVAKLLTFQPEETASFWDRARYIRNSIVETAREENVQQQTDLLRDFVNGMGKEGFEKISERFNREILVSNIGQINYGSTFGKLKLNAVWGPALHSGFQDEYAFAVNSINGRCNILVTSREQYGQIFLEQTVKTLITEVCR